MNFKFDMKNFKYLSSQHALKAQNTNAIAKQFAKSVNESSSKVANYELI